MAASITTLDPLTARAARLDGQAEGLREAARLIAAQAQPAPADVTDAEA